MIEQAITGFKEVFGYEPQGVWSAPGRANLIGEHTDYNEGFVFPFGIDKRTYVALSPRSDSLCRVSSDIDGKTYETDLSSKPEGMDWALYPLGVAWVMREWAKSGFDAFFTSNVPVGSGLSSSAAIECAIGVALNEIWSAGRTKQQIALLGQRAENDVVGAPTGMMDQTASMLAERDSAVFLDCQSLEAKVVPLHLEERDLVVAVIDTRVAHRHSDGGYRVRRESCERGASTMGVKSLRGLSAGDLPKAQSLLSDVDFRRVRHIVTENQRVLDSIEALQSGDMPRFGQLLLASHDSMAHDFEISIEELDLAVEVAMQTGAVGARMTGGGFGGAAIAVINKDLLGTLEQNCKQAFAQKGYLEPKIFAVVPSEGAKRER
ncbi:MAG: Cmm like protein [Actinomycetota bacterium]